LQGAIPGADVFIGVSAPNLLTASDVESMADRSIVFALATPDPEIQPAIARQYAAVVATGRSDYPNQINNVLAFPGIFRGLLDAQSHGIGVDVLLAAADAVASTVAPDELNANYIVPSVFHPDVHQRVAAAVRAAAKKADEAGASSAE
jgi:malate dehydrogenase (oxaloacetate-decarboxylating)